MRRWVGLCVLLVGGCKSDPHRVAPAPPSAAPSVVPPSAPAEPAHSAVSVDPLTRARALVSAWDAALNRHDATALSPLYASRVNFYGRTSSRDELIQAKQRALAAAPDYEQSLSNLTLANDTDGTVKVSFTKRSGAKNAQRAVDASLRLTPSGEGFLIASESDAPTDARADSKRSCMEVALDAVYALPAVARLFKEAPADARPGGVTYSDEPSRGSAAVGFHHDDHFETVFMVDVEAGKLSVGQSSESLPIPSAVQARVRAKCSAR